MSLWKAEYYSGLMDIQEVEAETIEEAKKEAYVKYLYRNSVIVSKRFPIDKVVKSVTLIREL